MKTKNVIISLVLVLALFVLALMKLRFWEPHKKITLNRNPSRIEYSQFSLCRMDCYHINANDITVILKKGVIDVAKTNLYLHPCPVFSIQGVTAKGVSVSIIILQCGTVAKIITCYSAEETVACNCLDDNERPISFFKNNY